jgi:ribosomal protein S18 acetylase RimI-like enzyme
LSIAVRQLTVEDSECAQSLVRTFHRSAVSRRYLEHLLSDPANLLLVAEAEDAVVGFIWAHWLDRIRLERKQLFIYEIEVDSNFRRRGAGARLLGTAITMARERAADTFVLTNRSNEAAVALYRHLGGVIKGAGDDLMFFYPAVAPSV